MPYYHGTNEVFEKFSLDFAARPGMASNGHLGIWLAKDLTLASRFGKVCLLVDVQSTKAADIDIGEISLWHRQCGKVGWWLSEEEASIKEREFYAEKRRALLYQGYDLINVIEVDGKTDMSIGLIPENLSVLKAIFM